MDLQRRVELQYQQSGLAIKLWHQSFQRLDQLALLTYSRSPQLDVTYQRRLSKFWNVRAIGSWVQFKRTADDFFAPFPDQIQQLEQNQGLYGERLHMQPELSYQRRWPGAFVAGAGGNQVHALFSATRYSCDRIPGLVILRRIGRLAIFMLIRVYILTASSKAVGVVGYIL